MGAYRASREEAVTDGGGTSIPSRIPFISAQPVPLLRVEARGGEREGGGGGSAEEEERERDRHALLKWQVWGYFVEP